MFGRLSELKQLFKGALGFLCPYRSKEMKRDVPEHRTPSALARILAFEN